MNYFAHGYRYRDQPYFLAGTAVPDWLNVVDRQVRVRRKAALPYVEDCDPQLAQLARGVVQHHDDDAWFHALPTFNELNFRFTKELGEVVPALPGIQRHFLGHILVELLLDAELIARFPQRLEEYYHVVAGLDARMIETALQRMSGKSLEGFHRWIDRFVEERFLADYADDERLLLRLNQVMRRVRLDPIPVEIIPWLASARETVAAHREQLLPPEPA